MSVLFGMVAHDFVIKPISAILNYVGRNRKDPWDGCWEAAMGVQHPDGGNPGLVNLKSTYFMEEGQAPQGDRRRLPMMAAHWWASNQDNFFNVAMDDLDDVELWVPKLILLLPTPSRNCNEGNPPPNDTMGCI